MYSAYALFIGHCNSCVVALLSIFRDISFLIYEIRVNLEYEKYFVLAKTITTFYHTLLISHTCEFYSNIIYRLSKIYKKSFSVKHLYIVFSLCCMLNGLIYQPTL
jgi:hypothetical protein